jgi:hypothetical protein
METPADIKDVVGRLPEPDKDGKLTGPAPEEAEKLYQDVLAGGRERLLALVDLIVEPGPGDDWKARYLLHGIVIHVGRPGAEAKRKMVTETLAAQLGGARPKAVQAFLCQELQAGGTKEAVPALGKLLTDEDLCDPAARALLSIGEGVVDPFRSALPKAPAKCRQTILQGLGALRDAGSASAFKAALDDTDREIRLAAGWGLARIADAGAVDLLLKAADGKEGWERIQATKHCLVLAGGLRAAGKAAEAGKVYKHLMDTRTDPSERYIREAAAVALGGK